MSTPSRPVLRVLMAVAAWAVMTPSSASAQSGAPQPPSMRPWAGLAPGRGGVERLAVSVDLFGGWSVAREPAWNLPFGTVQFGGPTRTAIYGTNGSLDYAVRRRRVTFAAGGTASGRQYAAGDGEVLGSYSGRMQLSGEGRRVSWQLAQGMMRSPLTATQFFPGVDTGDIGGLSLVDFQIAGTSQWVSETDAQLSVGTRRHRVSMSAGYGLSALDAADRPSAERFDRRSGSVRYTLRLGRYAEWYAGYGRTDTRRWTVGAPTRTPAPALQNLDLGLGIARPLSFSRRTTVALQTGAVVLDDSAGRASYTAVGSASLQREFGRSWTARLVASRDTRFVTAVFEPVTSTGLTAQLLGTVLRRAQVLAVASTASGAIGDPTSDVVGRRDFTSRAVSTQLRIRVAGAASVYAEYVYSQSSFGAGPTLQPISSVPAAAQSVRVGLSLGTSLRSDRSR